MPLKPFYCPESGCGTDKTDKFRAQVRHALMPIIEEWEQRGYSLREMQLLVAHTLDYDVAHKIIKKARSLGLGD